ncbi:RNA polymerase subunit sigma-70, partial [Streptomyces sp. SID625]|nr:RNA polymerase subunit sigma-70 [Streptomyces sp. SID625]
MREQVSNGVRRARDFEAFVAGAAGRLLHTATLLTAEAPDDNPRARRLLTLALAHTYACWDRLRGEDPYERARQALAARFAR